MKRFVRSPEPLANGTCRGVANESMRHFCTYFDQRYLIRGLTLYHSLRAHAVPFKLWVLCFDDLTYEILSGLNLPDLKPVSLKEFEQDDEALLAAKQNRSLVEYYFTCSPSWPLYLLNSFPEIDLITYLDADLFFYSSPSPIFDELGDRSILIIGHRFPERLRAKEIYGIYNVGLLSFRNSEQGRECLEWWRASCLEWCHDYPEGGRFADQKYLDDWPTRFEQVVVLQNKGAGLAPWNWMNYKIQTKNGRMLVDGQPLIFYHFHALKILNRWLYDPVFEGETYGIMPFLPRWRIYHPYVQALKKTATWVRHMSRKANLDQSHIRGSDYELTGLLGKIARGRIMVNYGLQ